MSRKWKLSGWALSVVLAVHGTMAQRLPDAAAHPYVQAVAEATASAQPDQARIDIGVTTQGTDASAVAAQNSAQVNAVLAELRKLVGSGGEIKTAGYSVAPNYSYPKEGGTPVIKGYTATNIVQVTVDDLAQVGKIIDGATRNGANQIQRLQFTLKNPQPLRARALRDAAAQAKANAEAMAAGVGLKVTRILSLEEGAASPVVPLARTMAMAAVPNVPTPVEAGTIDVHVTVTLRVELGQ